MYLLQLNKFENGFHTLYNVSIRRSNYLRSRKIYRFSRHCMDDEYIDNFFLVLFWIKFKKTKTKNVTSTLCYFGHLTYISCFPKRLQLWDKCLTLLKDNKRTKYLFSVSIADRSCNLCITQYSIFKKQKKG